MNVGWTHSVQQVDFLLQLPDEVIFVLVGLQQPDVLLALSGQLLKNTQTHTIQHDDYTNDKYFHQLKTVRHIWFKPIATGPQTAL